MVRDIKPSDKVSLAVVHCIYEISFPKSERRPWDSLLALMSSGSIRMLGIYDDEALIGFITLWSLPGFKYIEHFAIVPECRNGGFGQKALRHVLRNCSDDLPVVLEVERPEASSYAPRRIDFYRRCGFVPCTGLDYIQPPYSPDLPPVPLMLMVANSPGTPAQMLRCADLLLYFVYGERPSACNERLGDSKDS